MYIDSVIKCAGDGLFGTCGIIIRPVCRQDAAVGTMACRGRFRRRCGEDLFAASGVIMLPCMKAEGEAYTDSGIRGAGKVLSGACGRSHDVALYAGRTQQSAQ